MKKRLSLLLAAAMLLLAACGETETQASTAQIEEGVGTAQASPAESDGSAERSEASADTVIAHSDNDMFTDRDYEIGCSDAVTVTLEGNTASADGPGAEAADGAVTITRAGSYVLSGSLEGQVVVDVPDTEKVQLMLDGAEITCENSAAIYIRSADKVFLTTARESSNEISTTGAFVQTDGSNVDGAVFAKSDLTLNGAGSLNVRCETGHGVVTKDDLKITGGTCSITAAGQGLSGKNSVRVAGGEISIDSGKDGIHAQHDEDPEKGFIYVIGGTLAITSGGDALDASGTVTVEGGSFRLTANGGAENAPVQMETRMGGMYPTGDTQTDLDDLTSDSYKGIKGANISVSGGDFEIDTADDAVHSGGTMEILGGSFRIRTGDDGLHADSSLTVSDGEIIIESSYEGIESELITISGGRVSVIAADDAMNAGGSAPQLTVSGGDITVNSGGDSLDSNGSLSISGGNITVSGPEHSGNGMLDYDGGGEITGGTLLAAGAMGMNQNFGTGSTQCSILADLPSAQTAGTAVTVKDSGGKEIAAYAPEKAYQSVLVSTPELAVGETYTITAGNETVTVELTDTIYGAGGGFGGRGPKG